MHKTWEKLSLLYKNFKLDGYVKTFFQMIVCKHKIENPLQFFQTGIFIKNKFDLILYKKIFAKCLNLDFTYKIFCLQTYLKQRMSQIQ